MIELFIDQYSSFSGNVDFLFDLITYIAGFWFLIAEGAIFYFLFRYRKKPGVKSEYVDGTNKRHKRWISIPHFLIIACDIVLIIGSAKVWYKIKQSLPEPDSTIGIVSQQWAWTFIHPGKDGKLHTNDDIQLIDELHIEVGKNYHYELTSKDTLHSFSVPTFRLKQDAVPGRKIRGWFKADKKGVVDIQCAEMCGIGHGVMNARLFIHTKEEFREWQQRQPRFSMTSP